MNWVENGQQASEFVCSTEKKNIFLIGDSIRKGYCPTVRKELEGQAEVFYFEDNCRSTQYVIFSLKKWAALFDHPERVDLVHFNCGQWDVAHFNGYPSPLTSPEEYEKNIRMIFVLLRKFFPNARLVFATTSPMNPDGGSTGGINPRSTEDVARYNRIAVRIAEENDVAINDLFAFMQNFGSNCFIDTCHLTPDAFARVGREVARYLRQYL